MQIALHRSFHKLPAAVFTALLAIVGAQATTLARLSLDQLAAGADAVARVRCLSANARWESGSIWTVITARVMETMKGSLAAEITVRVPGGRAGHFTESVDGVPKLRPGDDAVLFLQTSSGGGYSVAGWVEGTFHISRDARARTETITQDSSAFAVFDPATRAFRSEGIRHMPLEEFRAVIAASIARATVTARGEGKLP
jgi:hypothetical protein